MQPKDIGLLLVQCA